MPRTTKSRRSTTRDARVVAISYETDADAAAALLPAGVILPLPAVAFVLIAEYRWSTFGPYNEAILGINCEWEGERHAYLAHLVTDSVPPLVGGRELWGYPKKIAQIRSVQEQEVIQSSVERPAGTRLLGASMRPERPLTIDGRRLPRNALAARVIPSVEAGAPPSIAELVQTPNSERVVHEAWTGATTAVVRCPVFARPVASATGSEAARRALHALRLCASARPSPPYLLRLGAPPGQVRSTHHCRFVRLRLQNVLVRDHLVQIERRSAP